jgi:membrane fusion protein (multidrug efflux system)
MAKRMIFMLGIAVLVVGALGFVKFRQVKAVMAVYAAYQPPPEAVTTIVARQERWPTTISAIGTVAPVRGVTLSADLAGVVERILFESGETVAQGDILVELDTRQERAQLTAAEADRDLARANHDRIRSLVDERVISRAEFDRVDAEYKRAEARVGEIRAAIGRKTIRAPFAGVLGIRQINLGEYLAAGAAIAPLQALTPVYVNFSVPQQSVAVLKRGTEVRVTLDASDRESVGRVTAIDAVIDPATRNAQIQATFANSDGRLRPGMFVQAAAAVGDSAPLIPIPASAINYAPFGDSVFVIQTLKNSKGETYRGVQQRFVKVGAARGDQVAVVSGIAAGEEVVTSGVFKLRNNAAVQINNAVQPSNSAAPGVEDR